MAVSPMARPQLVSGGKYANIFQPPAPSPVTSTPSQNDYFSSNSRKRQRADSSMGKSMCSNHDRCVRSPSEDITFSTESLNVNDRYKLKGGFDTPGLLAATELDTPVDLDINARRMTRDPEPTMRITDPSFAGPLARERNGFARVPVSRNDAGTSPSWTRYALTLPFSLAGKVFSFGTTVLKGFYAGGGQGFELDGRWHADQDTPLPGSYYESPQQDYAFAGDFEQDNTPTARPPPNKRRLTDRDSWVMVGSPDMEVTTPTSPKRRPTSSGMPRRPLNIRTASRKAVSRRQSYNTAMGSPPILSMQISEPARISLPLSPTRHSPRSAYHSPEAERFARRQAKNDRVTDKTMNNMSRQLEDLIRQGQAALGTKFTVEDNGFDDEGFVDEY